MTRRLLSLDRPSAADMAEVHREMVSAPAQAYVGFLQDVTPENPEAARAKAKLLGWNCRMDAAAVEPTIYSAFRDALLKDLLEGYLGPELAQASWKPEGRGLGLFLGRLKARLIVLIAADDRGMLAPGETWQGLMSRALTRAVAELADRLGGDMEGWQWGLVHRARPPTRCRRAGRTWPTSWTRRRCPAAVTATRHWPEATLRPIRYGHQPFGGSVFLRHRRLG